MPSHSLLLLIGLLVAATVLSVLAKELKPRRGYLSKPWPVAAKRFFLSERERALYARLVQALPDQRVFAQVALSQVIEFKGGSPERWIRNHFKQLTLDFLVVTADTRPWVAIELDDSTHNRSDRRQADARKTHALQSAGIALIRWNAKKLPEVSEIQAAIAAAPAPQSR